MKRIVFMSFPCRLQKFIMNLRYGSDLFFRNKIELEIASHESLARYLAMTTR
jgi:hypothetical protein